MMGYAKALNASEGYRSFLRIPLHTAEMPPPQAPGTSALFNRHSLAPYLQVNDLGSAQGACRWIVYFNSASFFSRDLSWPIFLNCIQQMFNSAGKPSKAL